MTHLTLVFFIIEKFYFMVCAAAACWERPCATLVAIEAGVHIEHGYLLFIPMYTQTRQ